MPNIPDKYIIEYIKEIARLKQEVRSLYNLIERLKQYIEKGNKNECSKICKFCSFAKRRNK